ncbi:PspC domain-containing protein [Corynebacterium spheniscorum]|uniref:Phage shock protein C (PspC) family protein n=1 Tax=Corynebacterium spheniscorum TaxID=185761 RepID=A0A1I2RT34_9CORY|nr:PspC domain-containing protein [Corynebacterium spheniscorum]KAA8724047.1 PspC domain-containing protein [Corynebacterium spheniscorum]SFG42689.1 phage shock protein C (PspC) family protein [Corynebacterium spheniscorum]
MSLNDYNAYPQRRLHRSRSNRMIAGICGGLAETYGWDATLVRIAVLLSCLLPGPQALIYFIAWFIIPKD